VVTALQVKRYLRPLLDANDDLALVGRLLVVKPVTHILRGVIIDRQSWAEAITPKWFCYPLFLPYEGYSLKWSDQLWGRNWKTSDPVISEALCREIEAVAFPKVRPVDTIEAFHRAIPVLSVRYGHDWEKLAEEKFCFDIAEGDLESARRLAKTEVLTWPKPGPKDAPATHAKWDGTKKLCGLLAKNDVVGLIRTLHEWEETKVRALKLVPYWQPTPFPIEENLGLTV
jgi:hypothetical protein